ncbi:MAG: hypothetical protein H7301_03980 [Cryobacterium sp.]|nr:hypothetical protein [Oligoflexia bacterium]
MHRVFRYVGLATFSLSVSGAYASPPLLDCPGHSTVLYRCEGIDDPNVSSAAQTYYDGAVVCDMGRSVSFFLSPRNGNELSDEIPATVTSVPGESVVFREASPSTDYQSKISIDLATRDDANASYVMEFWRNPDRSPSRTMNCRSGE